MSQQNQIVWNVGPGKQMIGLIPAVQKFYDVKQKLLRGHPKNAGLHWHICERVIKDAVPLWKMNGFTVVTIAGKIEQYMTGGESQSLTDLKTSDLFSVLS